MDIAVRNYDLERLKAEPVIHLSEMIGLHEHRSFIMQNREKCLPIIVGVILYRQLDHLEKNKVLPQANALGNPRFLYSIQSILAQVIAQPSWNPWSYSDAELLEFFKLNKSVDDFIGTYFFTIDPKVDVSFIVGTIYGVAKVGFKGYLSESAGAAMVKDSLSKVSSNSAMNSLAARAFFVSVILASAMKKFSATETKKAKEELLARGLLTKKDL